MATDPNNNTSSKSTPNATEKDDLDNLDLVPSDKIPVLPKPIILTNQQAQPIKTKCPNTSICSNSPASTVKHYQNRDHLIVPRTATGQGPSVFRGQFPPRFQPPVLNSSHFPRSQFHVTQRYGLPGHNGNCQFPHVSRGMNLSVSRNQFSNMPRGYFPPSSTVHVPPYQVRQILCQPMHQFITDSNGQFPSFPPGQLMPNTKLQYPPFLRGQLKPDPKLHYPSYPPGQKMSDPKKQFPSCPPGQSDQKCSPGQLLPDSMTSCPPGQLMPNPKLQYPPILQGQLMPDPKKHFPSCPPSQSDQKGPLPPCPPGQLLPNPMTSCPPGQLMPNPKLQYPPLRGQLMPDPKKHFPSCPPSQSDQKGPLPPCPPGQLLPDPMLISPGQLMPNLKLQYPPILRGQLMPESKLHYPPYLPGQKMSDAKKQFPSCPPGQSDQKGPFPPCPPGQLLPNLMTSCPPGQLMPNPKLQYPPLRGQLMPESKLHYPPYLPGQKMSDAKKQFPTCPPGQSDQKGPRPPCPPGQLLPNPMTSCPPGQLMPNPKLQYPPYPPGEKSDLKKQFPSCPQGQSVPKGPHPPCPPGELLSDPFSAVPRGSILLVHCYNFPLFSKSQFSFPFSFPFCVLGQPDPEGPLPPSPPGQLLPDPMDQLPRFGHFIPDSSVVSLSEIISGPNGQGPPYIHGRYFADPSGQNLSVFIPDGNRNFISSRLSPTAPLFHQKDKAKTIVKTDQQTASFAVHNSHKEVAQSLSIEENKQILQHSGTEENTSDLYEVSSIDQQSKDLDENVLLPIIKLDLDKHLSPDLNKKVSPNLDVQQSQELVENKLTNQTTLNKIKMKDEHLLPDFDKKLFLDLCIQSSTDVAKGLNRHKILDEEQSDLDELLKDHNEEVIPELVELPDLDMQMDLDDKSSTDLEISPPNLKELSPDRLLSLDLDGQLVRWSNSPLCLRDQYFPQPKKWVHCDEQVKPGLDVKPFDEVPFQSFEENLVSLDLDTPLGSQEEPPISGLRTLLKTYEREDERPNGQLPLYLR